jgi:hypothetical protein
VQDLAAGPPEQAPEKARSILGEFSQALSRPVPA